MLQKIRSVISLIATTVVPALVVGIAISYALAEGVPAVAPARNISVPVHSSGIFQTITDKAALNTNPSPLGSANPEATVGLLVGEGGQLGVGIATPSADLHVKSGGTGAFKGAIFAENYCDQDGRVDKTHCVDLTKVLGGSQGDDLPQGSIMLFQGVGCPVGWLNYTFADARYIGMLFCKKS